MLLKQLTNELIEKLIVEIKKGKYGPGPTTLYRPKITFTFHRLYPYYSFIRYLYLNISGPCVSFFISHP